MHTIRLRHPWEKTRVDAHGDSDDLRSSQRIDVPEDGTQPTHFATRDQAGTQRAYCYQRKFNHPTGLSETSRVHLRISGWDGKLDSLDINEQSLDTSGDAIDIEITTWLIRRNQIELVLRDTTDMAARLSGEVALVIVDPNQDHASPFPLPS